jgi:peptide subunit release factor 1 (eRF1)
MNANSVLLELAAYRGVGNILSIYLDTDLRDKSKEAVRLMLRDRLRGIEHQLPVDVLQRVGDYLDFEFDWRPRGLAIFVSDDLWQVVPLPIAVPVQSVWAAQAYVRPLSDVIDRFGAYNVALIDRQSLRVFSVRMGEILAQTEALGEALKRHRQGGWSAQIYQRRQDNLATQNLKQSAEALEAFNEETGVRRLVLGGSPDVLTQFREVLSRHLQEQIVGEFNADISASNHKALQLSLDVAQQADAAQERALVAEAITAANKGGQGVIGMADTVYALHQGRARLLLVSETFHDGAHVCVHCGSVSAEAHSLPAECPLCGHDTVTRVDDVANLALRKAIETGAAVNIVRANAELDRAGGMAALLRY